MQKVAYMSTISNILMLLSPSGKILMKLTKLDVDLYVKSIAGIWQSYELNSDSVSILLKANDTSIQLCNGNGLIDYVIPKPNSVNFKIRSVKSCQNNDFFSAMFSTAYMRNFNDQLWLYNSDAQLQVKLRNLAELPGNKDLTWATPPPKQQ